MNRRRAVTPRQPPAVLLLVVGMLLAIGVPSAWAITHRDPALTPVGAGVAVALAQSRSAADDSGGGGSAGATAQPNPAQSDTLLPVTTATTSAAVRPPSTPAPNRSPGLPRTNASRPRPDSAVTTAREATRATSKAVAPEPIPIVPGPAATSAAPAPTPAPSQPPVRLQIPAIGVDAPVGAVGIDDRGEMAIPEQVQDIGWYKFGPAPGSGQGSAVLSGHVDSAQQGLGAFARLGDLQAGDAITVTDTAGRLLRFRVVAKEAFDKKTVPLAALFSRSGAARLTLITCGGDFDSAARSYLDNIVVTAVPA